MALPFLSAQHKQSMFVRIEPLVPPNGKMYQLINSVCLPWIEHPVFVPTVGQCTTRHSVHAIIGGGRFVSFSLSPVPDRLYVLFVVTFHRGILLGIISYCIVETLNYANIMSVIIYYLLQINAKKKFLTV